MYQLDYTRQGNPYIRFDRHHPSAWRPFTSLDGDLEITARLCQSCVQVITRALLLEPSEVENNKEEVQHLDGLLSSLFRSAESCDMCRLIAGELSKRAEVYGYVVFANQSPAQNGLFQVLFKQNDLRLGYYPTIPFDRLGYYPTIPFDLYRRPKQQRQPVPGDQVEEEEKGKKGDERVMYGTYSAGGATMLVNASEGYPASPQHLQLARTWMDKCREKHSLCRSTRGSRPLPKRVLDISQLPTVRLYEPAPDEVARYAALSYCWGKGVPITTTTTNLARHRGAGIPLSEFPLTLRESIGLARGLGFRYLWIDALCIIQDSASDWRDQAAKMTSIYQGCALNIAITDADSCDAGTCPRWDDVSLLLGSSRPPPDGKKRGKTKTKEEVRLAARRFGRHNSPLLSRGWVFQETLVSVGTLFVSWAGLSWECCSAQYKQDGFAIEDHIHAINSQKWELASRSTKEHWYRWMAEYSRRALTKDGDKLPAVAGIAAHYHGLFGLTYTAGLWAEDLHLGLVWAAVDPAKIIRRETRAPSWSWASVDGPIQYPNELNVTKYTAVVDTTDLQDLAVVRLSIDEDFPGTYGTVSGGRIEADVSLYHVMLHPPPQPDQRRLLCFLDEKSSSSPKLNLSCTVDEAHKIKHHTLGPEFSHPCWLARVCSISLNDAPEIPGRPLDCSYFLILELADSGGGHEASASFRRIGLAQGRIASAAAEAVPCLRKRIILV